MALKSVNLDDRTWQQLVDTALVRARESCPEWTDMTAGDPGRVLIELCAFITENMIYRLNRLPEKAYVEFLDLLGVSLQPPAAAAVTLEFSSNGPGDRVISIPRGTRVAAERSGDAGAITFATVDPVEIPAGATSVAARALHCDWIEGELAGRGTGFAGVSVHVKRPPIIAKTGDNLDLVVGVEALPEELTSGVPVIRHGEKPFRIWQEKEGFVDLGADRCVYVVDRASGLISFAPALQMRGAEGELSATAKALADAPTEGREIRVWYRSGGGAAGNVGAGALTKLKDAVPGVAKVINPSAATGGRDAETVENALQRGPQELHSLRRAVTARDFESLALRSTSAINRAFAYTMFNLWKYAPRGTVELICMPDVPAELYGDGPVTRAMLESRASPEALQQVRKALETCKPLGTNLVARFGHCKMVRVETRVVVFREEDAAAVRDRVLKRLYETITPLDRGPARPGWSFGQPLSAYDVYRILSSEPGVKYVDPIRLCVDEVPAADVSALSVDGYQPGTWYAAVGAEVFRSLNDGDGWEQVAQMPEKGIVKFLQAYQPEAAGRAQRAGLIAAIAEFGQNTSRVLLSRDCGESWQEIGKRLQFRIDDMAWTDREGEPSLLLATEKGLYALAITPNADPIPIVVDTEHVDRGFIAVAVSTDVWGNTCVAVAADQRGGVFLSSEGGKPETFKLIGLADENIGTLAVQHEGSSRYLWVGFQAVGEDLGKGAARWQLPAAPDGWEYFKEKWGAGGCVDLAFVDGTVLAATRRHGVLNLHPVGKDAPWSAPDTSSGFPVESLGRMKPVRWLAATPRSELAPDAVPRVMAAGPAGVYRSGDGGRKYELCSRKEFADRVTLPDTWLFCSDVHQIEVTHDAARRD